MALLVQGEIVSHMERAPGVFMVEFIAPNLATVARPGQFLHIRCSEGNDPLLRRPISIHAVDRDRGRVGILFQVVGRGTALLARRKDGVIDVMGPLGRGFSTGSHNLMRAGSIAVVGGGIGAAPLFFLLQELARCGDPARVKVLLGARSANQILIKEEIENLGYTMELATDDGSVGHRGQVTELLLKLLPEGVSYVYACGPAPMLKAVCAFLSEAGIPGEVSLEERMACGVGACLSCACQVKAAGGGVHYRRACVDGPVFPAGEVVW
ncbi:dihydroorotate dehydrogenase electron transfer subunit [Desulfotruncus alcoholivorax]|uniref:dihydroorotate dehydrogenase electron transfer subunit n=1 Tax=Desulfotruncus alcoholivorax TaxID=265477 RepID=UPI00048087FC|nr:dihydroorotate dehydrogenase electron transfer subunit [Desulfotruncus alcoholivorax]